MKYFGFVKRDFHIFFSFSSGCYGLSGKTWQRCIQEWYGFSRKLKAVYQGMPRNIPKKLKAVYTGMSRIQHSLEKLDSCVQCNATDSLEKVDVCVTRMPLIGSHWISLKKNIDANLYSKGIMSQRGPLINRVSFFLEMMIGI